MRAWPGLAAIGAGLVHLGTAAGSAPAALVLLALVGAMEAGWGVAALARPEPPVPGAALAGAVLLLAGLVVALTLPGAGGHHDGGATDLPIGALAGGGALDLATALLLALRLRRGSRPAVEPGPAGFLVGTAVAAALVAAVAAASLAGTAVGAGHAH